MEARGCWTERPSWLSLKLRDDWLFFFVTRQAMRPLRQLFTASQSFYAFPAANYGKGPWHSTLLENLKIGFTREGKLFRGLLFGGRRVIYLR
jgi:hypothetical protein